jgi:hypothetical protein
MDREDRAHDFKLARLNFVLNEINSSNTAIFKLLTVYQTLVTAIIGALLGVAVNMSDAGSPRLFMAVATGLRSLFLVLSGFVAAIVLAQLFSWFDYRREETLILQGEVDFTFRSRPSWRNAWRWPETYLLAVIAIFTFVCTRFVFTPVLAHIGGNLR